MSKKWLGNLMLLLAAVIWGGGFVSQTEAMKVAAPFAFQATRFLIGGIALLPVIALMDKKGISKKPDGKKAKKHQLISGIICGLILFSACTPQQLGLFLKNTSNRC